METRLTFATGYNTPPFLQEGATVVVSISNDSQQNFSSAADRVTNPNQYPVTFKAEGLPDFTFPIDPLISVGFRNIITRRTVSKGSGRGSIKERWTEDDVMITITGVFISESEDEFPDEVNQLREFYLQRKSVDVVCTFLNSLDINRLAIESFDLPPTKGISNQAYQLRAYSDDDYELLIQG